MSEQNREKEERLFRSLSGVEEELLHRSEQNEGVEKRKANGKIRRFPLYYVSRIAAACLCFVVTAGTDGAVTGNLQAAQKNDSMDEKQRSQPAVSGNEASGAEDSMEEAEQDQEETLIEKQKSPSLEKMKTKGQQ